MVQMNYLCTNIDSFRLRVALEDLDILLDSSPGGALIRHENLYAIGKEVIYDSIGNVESRIN